MYRSYKWPNENVENFTCGTVFLNVHDNTAVVLPLF